MQSSRSGYHCVKEGAHKFKVDEEKSVDCENFTPASEGNYFDTWCSKFKDRDATPCAEVLGEFANPDLVQGEITKCPDFDQFLRDLLSPKADPEGSLVWC